jgi:hypothetical protein
LTICRKGAAVFSRVDTAQHEKTVIFSEVDLEPPPRNQSKHLQKITVWPNNTGFCVWIGVRSGNNFVTGFAGQS